MSAVSPACGRSPRTSPNIDEFLFLPVAAGFRRQHELWDGIYTLDDLPDIMELIRVRKVNEARAAVSAKGAGNAVLIVIGYQDTTY